MSSGHPANEGIYTASAPFFDLHAPKNVMEMVDFCRFAMGRHAKIRVQDVLEFGCGTGRLLLPLASQGYQVVGTDVSEPMIAICRERAAELGLKPQLRCELMQDFAEVDRYDAMVTIFGAVAFLVDDDPIRQFLFNCHKGLRPGGILLVDVPNGLDGLVNSWAKTTPETYEKDDVLLERFLQQIPDTLHGTSRYRDTGFFRTKSGTGFYQEEYLLRIFSLPLFRLLLEPVPFRQMTCYCNWSDREPMQLPYSRLILILEK